MPFNITQILGGWRRKESAKKRADKLSSPKISRQKVQAVARPDLEIAKEIKSGGDAPKNIKNKGGLAWKLIESPHISEKATMLGENKYVFRVAGEANKHLLKNAIETRYGVKIKSVNILQARDKKRRHGATIGIKSGFKKAIVALKDGQAINEF